jgi:SAM-dependent methyltransferase
MRAQRPTHLPPAVDAVAENLPFPDDHFDAAMATFTLHQWPDFRAGLREMRRVARGVVVVLTCDPDEVRNFWLNDYAPAVLAAEARRYPAIRDIAATLGGSADVRPVLIPLECRDGFNEAYYGRPEFLLDPAARRACSAWSFIEPHVAEDYARHLREDLASGAWDRKFGHLRARPELAGSLRLIVARR